MQDGYMGEPKGLQLTTVVGVIFVILKLVHVIDWSWWWVTVPFWGGYAITLILWIIFGVILRK